MLFYYFNANHIKFLYNYHCLYNSNLPITICAKIYNKFISFYTNNLISKHILDYFLLLAIDHAITEINIIIKKITEVGIRR